jgi:hypothetical protein
VPDSAISSLDFGAFLLATARGDHESVVATLRSQPAYATHATTVGATRARSRDFFISELERYIYKGDTALHIAGAAWNSAIATMLLDAGAALGATNRLGAAPLHYTATGSPGSSHWNPTAQVSVIALLIERGANANAVDKRRVTPLHVAVRSRCADAVQALIARGADIAARNATGSTPLDLALRTTGRTGSSGDEAREQQRRIVTLLQERGATNSSRPRRALY